MARAGQASRAVLSDGQLRIDIIVIEASSSGEDGNALPFFGPRCRSTTQSPSVLAQAHGVVVGCSQARSPFRPTRQKPANTLIKCARLD